MSATYALGHIKNKRAVKPLINALKDEDKDIRIFAAISLGRIKDDRAVEPLINAIKDEDRFVRYWSAIALGKMGKQLLSHLLMLLRTKIKVFKVL